MKKLFEIAAANNLNHAELQDFIISSSDIPHKNSFYSGISLEEQYVPLLLSKFKEHQKEKTAEKERMNQAESEKRHAMANMLITSGFHFDGYRIVKYSGYISGDDAISVPRKGIFQNSDYVSDSLMNSLSQIRRKALAELKEAAYDLGCNAVIGVDFDYLTLEPETANLNGGTLYLPYVFGVTANGNAVVIEKIEEPVQEHLVYTHREYEPARAFEQDMMEPLKRSRRRTITNFEE